MKTTVNVQGMMCEHCQATVQEALAALPGVDKVKVDLKGGQATIKSKAEPDLAAVEAAVVEAGYTYGGVAV
jgi:copper chaperone CopZ